MKFSQKCVGSILGQGVQEGDKDHRTQVSWSKWRDKGLKVLSRKPKNSHEIIEQIYWEKEHCGQSGKSEVRHFGIMTRPACDYTIVSDTLFQIVLWKRFTTSGPECG